jgi:membrane protein
MAARASASRARRTGAPITVADLVAAFKRFQRDQVPHHAAALTYYSLMSLFPALLLGVALLGLLGQEGLIGDAADYLRSAGAPSDTVNAITAALNSAREQRGTAVTALVLGSATALYGASGAFGAVGLALNHIWRVEEGRGFVKHKAQNLAWTLLLVLLVLVTFVLIFLGGGLANDVLGVIGLGDTAASLWRILRWPAALLVTMLIYAIVYFAAPNVEIRQFRFITPGAVFGVVAWILASALFFVYASNFSSYGATYGSFATIVVLLVWIWLTNLVLLFGAELNAVIDVRRSPELPPGYDGPPLPPKDPPDD